MKDRKIYLWPIRFIGLIVPRRLRADWRQEWEAELQWREQQLAEWDKLDQQHKLDLYRHSAGAFTDALWLQSKRWEDEMTQDLRYGVRMLVKNPGLTAVIVLLLALGIGVNAGVFTALNGLMMRARVDKDPESFAHLAPQYTGQFEQVGLDGALSLTDYKALQTGARSLDELAGWAIARVKLGDDVDTQMALLVTPNFFAVYGLEQAKLGRLFLAEEGAAPGSAPVVILSEELWRNRFGADPNIVGTTIKLNRQPFTVVGIAPARFSGRLRGLGIWLPYTMQPQFFGGKNFFQQPDLQWLSVDGRLKESRAAAQSELELLIRQQDQLQPGRKTTMVLTNGSLIEEPKLRAKIFWVPWLIMGALSLVLLLTCVNVTLLLLARAATRQREIAIRLALGAGWPRLVRMLLTESLLLAALAGAISAWLTYQMPSLFERTFVEAPNYPLRPDWKVFVYLAGVTLCAGCLAGLAPALESLRINLSGVLNGNNTMFGSGKKSWSGRNLLIGMQVAMSVVLLIFAGMFLHTQYTMFTLDPGFEVRQVLLAPLQVEAGRYTEEAATAFHQTLLQQVRALPSVQAVCYASAPPGAGGGLDANLVEFRLPGQEKGSGKLTGINVVSAEFFATFRIPLLAGRSFSDTAAAAQPTATEAVVSESFAHRFWGSEDALGKMIVDANGEQLRIVGIARDTKSSFGANEGPQLYRRFNQRFIGTSLMIRFAGDARPLTEALKNTVQNIDNEMTVAPQTLRSKLDEQASRFWVTVRLILLLGLIALLIAVIGIYGVVAFAVNRRTKEMGIRLALGAAKGNIVGLVLRTSMQPILAGLITGLVFAAAGSYVMVQILREMPIRLELRDPLVYLAVSLLLSLAAVGAIFGPALRAAKSDPLEALRQD